MGIFVVIAASLLGACSCMLIAWSLWTRSQARKRARARQLATGQRYAVGQPYAQPSGAYAQVPPIPAGADGRTVVVAPYGVEDPEPRTEFMGSGDLYGHAAPPGEPTQFLSAAELYGADGAYGEDHGGYGEDHGDEDAHEVPTAFMTEEELLAEAAAAEADEFEDEVPTAFMSTDELFGRGRPRQDATIVLTEQALAPDPPPPQPVWERPPVARVPPVPTPAPPPPLRVPELKPTLPGPKPAVAPNLYGGFVGDRSQDADYDEDDEHDPETELVHQAELLRRIGPGRRSE